MKVLNKKKYLLNNKIKGRQSVQLFIPETEEKSGTDGTDILQLLQVVENELKENNLIDEQKTVTNLITTLKLKSYNLLQW